MLPRQYPWHIMSSTFLSGYGVDLFTHKVDPDLDPHLDKWCSVNEAIAKELTSSSLHCTGAIIQDMYIGLLRLDPTQFFMSFSDHPPPPHHVPHLPEQSTTCFMSSSPLFPSQNQHTRYETTFGDKIFLSKLSIVACHKSLDSEAKSFRAELTMAMGECLVLLP